MQIQWFWRATCVSPPLVYGAWMNGNISRRIFQLSINPLFSSIVSIWVGQLKLIFICWDNIQCSHLLILFDFISTIAKCTYAYVLYSYFDSVYPMKLSPSSIDYRKYSWFIGCCKYQYINWLWLREAEIVT